MGLTEVPVGQRALRLPLKDKLRIDRCMTSHAPVFEMQYARIMPCLLVFLILLAPRVVLFLMWLLSNTLDRAYHGMLIPLLGFIFLPITTIVYAWMVTRACRSQGVESGDPDCCRAARRGLARRRSRLLPAPRRLAGGRFPICPPIPLLAADSAIASADEFNQVQRVLVGRSLFDPRQRVFQLQPGPIESLICLLQVCRPAPG